ncbi:hypothetical protein FGRMN_9261 [Fusarium graminum]|nr:hypothetical protein FGRMN_9261 [Fusarium graminum]
MGSNFLADINNNHAQECLVDWGPRFACGIKAITALGELLRVTRGESNISTLEIPDRHHNGSSATAGEMVQRCSRLYLDTFSDAEHNLSILSNIARELAFSRGPLHRVTEIFRKGSPAVTSRTFDFEIHRLTPYLVKAESHTRSLFTSWTCLLSFLRDFESSINKMAKSDKVNLMFVISLLVPILPLLLLCGILVRTIIGFGSCLFALLALWSGFKRSGHWETWNGEFRDETHYLEMESQRLTHQTKLNATTCQTLQNMDSSLASALGAVQEIHDSYRSVFDRFENMRIEKIDRLYRTNNSIFNTITMTERHPNSMINMWSRDSKDVTVGCTLSSTASELRSE